MGGSLMTKKKKNILIKARHHGEKPFLCKYCPKRFAKKQNLENHARIHTKERPFSCPLCHKAFARRCTLTRHLRTHLGVKPFPCPYCPEGRRIFLKVKTRKIREDGEKAIF